MSEEERSRFEKNNWKRRLLAAVQGQRCDEGKGARQIFSPPVEVSQSHPQRIIRLQGLAFVVRDPPPTVLLFWTGHHRFRPRLAPVSYPDLTKAGDIALSPRESEQQQQTQAVPYQTIVGSGRQRWRTAKFSILGRSSQHPARYIIDYSCTREHQSIIIRR